MISSYLINDDEQPGLKCGMLRVTSKLRLVLLCYFAMSPGETFDKPFHILSLFIADWFHIMLHQNTLEPSTSLGNNTNSAHQSSVLSDGEESTESLNISDRNLIFLEGKINQGNIVKANLPRKWCRSVNESVFFCSSPFYPVPRKDDLDKEYQSTKALISRRAAVTFSTYTRRA